eukprot:GILI01009029.1.p1 GENE.GILI01009029.1~~GILI01009029.1.p1  ORF type:complete len:374 (+),score=132.54 GILI01009029.1:92-1213(+)
MAQPDIKYSLLSQNVSEQRSNSRRKLIAFGAAALLCVGAVLVISSSRSDGTFLGATNDLPAVSNFLVLGDWGRGTEQAKATAAQMGTFCDKAQPACAFVVSTGDNFYMEGVESVSDPLWHQYFEDIYTAPSLQVNWLPVLGNHDHQLRRFKSQLDYSLQSPRWKFPDRNYFRDVEVEGGSARIIFLDTTPMLEEYQHDEPSYDAAEMRSLNSSQTWSQIEQMLREGADKKFLLVVGHHPLYSASTHGDNPDLQSMLLPLFTKYQVSAYFSGHDHNLQYLTGDVSTYEGEGKKQKKKKHDHDKKKRDSYVLHQFVSGAGSDLDNEMKQKHPFLSFGRVVNGFMAVAVTKDVVTVRLLDVEGAEIYKTEIKPRAH